MKKRLAALVLAGTMILGSGLTAMAESASIADMATAGKGTDITGTGSMELPTIKVTVPTEVGFVINPFAMEYTASDDNKYTDKIVSVPQEIVNESDVAIAVNVIDLTATGVPEGVLVTTTPVTDKTTTKSVFLYLEVAGAKEDGTYEFKSYAASNANQVAVPYVKADDTRTKKGAKDKLVVLGAGSNEATKAQFKIGGSVVSNPVAPNENKVMEAAPWTDADKFDITFKFTFTPQVVTTTSGS